MLTKKKKKKKPNIWNELVWIIIIEYKYITNKQLYKNSLIL